jgi:hypothetical protein
MHDYHQKKQSSCGDGGKLANSHTSNHLDRTPVLNWVVVYFFMVSRLPSVIRIESAQAQRR